MTVLAERIDGNVSRRVGFAVCVILACIAVLGLVLLSTGNTEKVARDWYIALLGWVLLPVGALPFLMTWHAIGGAWGRVLGPAFGALARCIPVAGLLFAVTFVSPDAAFPVADGLHEGAKAVWFEPGFFAARTVCYFMVWSIFAFLLPVPSFAADAPRRPGVAALGLILYAITASLAGVDWMMSLEHEFNSAVYGLLVIADQTLMALAFAILATLVAGTGTAADGPAPRDAAGGLSRLLLAMLLTWSYLFFVQYLIIWSADLPPEVTFFIKRGEGAWKWLTYALAALYVALPAGLLMPSPLRSDPRILCGAAVLIVALAPLERLWRTAPAYGPLGPWDAAFLVLFSLLTGAAIVSSFLWTFLRQRDRLRRAAT